MNLSSIGSASSVTSGFLSEPPLSPGPAPVPGPTSIPQLRTVETPPAAVASGGADPQPPLAPVAPVTPLAPAPPAVSEIPAVEAAPPAPAEAPAAHVDAPTLESLLLRMRLVTPDQIASAMREEAETGRPIAEIVVANGWVSADDLARIQSGTPRPPAPAPATPTPVASVEAAHDAAPLAPAPLAAPAPAPVAPAAPEPVAVAAPEPAPAEPTPAPVEPAAVEQPPTKRAGVAARVLVRLENGERIDVGQFGDFDAAKQRARELTTELQQAPEWPFLGGRFVRPAAIVSVDIDLTGF
jgi:pyruvate dehydrogenase E2 component (dihydrolipoamide acetyltransferase)